MGCDTQCKLNGIRGSCFPNLFLFLIGTFMSSLAFTAMNESTCRSDVPPVPMSILLGIQHYLTMLGATFLIPTLICPAMGANVEQTGRVISTIFFVSGLNTLVQTSIGDRLPIVQGGSFSYLPAVFGIIANPELQSIADDSERFLATMQVIQVWCLFMCLYSDLLGIFLFFVLASSLFPSQSHLTTFLFSFLF